jgi:hypothetical protein
MPKFVVDESEMIDPKAILKLSDFLEKLHEPYRMPQAMADWLHHDNEERGGVDTYYQVPVGYGRDAMSLRFTFKREMILMEFTDAFGMRLMELRLYA